MRTMWKGLAAAVCLLGGPSLAQISAGSVEERLGLEPREGVPPIGVQLRAGVSDYTGELGDTSELGPLLGFTVDARRYQELGAEFGYEGTRNEVSGDFSGNDEGGVLWRHNVSALLKGGPRIQNFMPFAAAGLGASYVNVTDEAEAEGFQNDFIAEVPLALGVEYRLGDFNAGVRGTYRVQFNEDFAEDTVLDDPGGNILSGSVTLGGRF